MHLAKVMHLAALDKSPDHHVFLHELIHGENLVNGVDLSHRMLLRAAQLKCDYPDQVHLILANHELAQMMNQGVSKGAGNSVELFNDGIEFAFGDDAAQVIAAMTAFMRAFPLALITESGILGAHSVPALPGIESFDFGIFNRDLTDADYTSSTGSAYRMVWGRRASQAHLEHLADRWGVRAFVLGHEHAETGCTPIGSMGVILNTDHEHAAVLALDLSADPSPADWPWSIQPLSAMSLPPDAFA